LSTKLLMYFCTSGVLAKSPCGAGKSGNSYISFGTCPNVYIHVYIFI
jgi:hypothetical protein